MLITKEAVGLSCW